MSKNFCPYCGIAFVPDYSEAAPDHPYPYHTNKDGNPITFKILWCSCLGCGKLIIYFTEKLANPNNPLNEAYFRKLLTALHSSPKTTIYPTYRHVTLSKHIPAHLAKDYKEATAILDISPKASAVLSRRCFQIILEEKGYKHRILADQVKLALKDNTLPKSISKCMDAVRNVGNNAAHVQRELESDIIVDVTHEEAQFLLQIIHRMFEHFYITPANDQKLTDLIDENLSKIGKPSTMKPTEPQE